jgi:hypothetical protein
MLLLTKATRRPAEGTTNPFKLPRGEKLRREVVAVFREQRTAIIRFLRTGEKDAAGLPVVRDQFRRRTPGRAGLAGLPRIAVVEGLKGEGGDAVHGRLLDGGVLDGDGAPGLRLPGGLAIDRKWG